MKKFIAPILCFSLLSLSAFSQTTEPKKSTYISTIVPGTIISKTSVNEAPLGTNINQTTPGHGGVGVTTGIGQIFTLIPGVGNLAAAVIDGTVASVINSTAGRPADPAKPIPLHEPGSEWKETYRFVVQPDFQADPFTVVYQDSKDDYDEGDRVRVLATGRIIDENTRILTNGVKKVYFMKMFEKKSVIEKDPSAYARRYLISSSTLKPNLGLENKDAELVLVKPSKEALDFIEKYYKPE